MLVPVVDTAEFRKVCGQFPTGVTAVTALGSDGTVAALTVNSFASVSLEPAKVLFCLADTSSSFPVISAAERIAIHVLRQDQEDVARAFAASGRTGEEKLSAVAWEKGPDGVPLVPGSAAVLVGRPDDIIPSGDHVIVLVDVDHTEHQPSALPALSFYRGRFASPTDAVATSER